MRVYVPSTMFQPSESDSKLNVLEAMNWKLLSVAVMKKERVRGAMPSAATVIRTSRVSLGERPCGRNETLACADCPHPPGIEAATRSGNGVRMSLVACPTSCTEVTFTFDRAVGPAFSTRKVSVACSQLSRKGSPSLGAVPE